MKTLAERLLLLMEERNLNQRRLAKLAGVQVSAINRWCTGETKNPKEEDLQKVAEVLDANAHWIRTGIGPMVPSPLAGLTEKDFQSSEMPPAATPSPLDLALLEQVLREVLTQAPRELPERQAQIAAEVYGLALRTRRLDRVAEMIKMLFS